MKLLWLVPARASLRFLIQQFIAGLSRLLAATKGFFAQHNILLFSSLFHDSKEMEQELIKSYGDYDGKLSFIVVS